MNELIGSLISNDSRFGKLMTKLGIIIIGNILFVLFSLPVVTIGASWAALSHVMLKAQRSNGVTNPFKQFWIGFKSNFKQATVVWLITLLLVVIGYFNVRICLSATGFIANVRYAVYALGVILVIVLIYLFPVMAAFENTLPKLIHNSIYFALHKPGKLIVLLFFHVFPLVLTYSDPQTMPLYAFLWTFFGFGAIAMLTARLLVPEFKPYLPLVDEYGDFVLDENGNKMKADALLENEEAPDASGISEKSEAEILEEMKKLGM